jgi:hypothetical protein
MGEIVDQLRSVASYGAPDCHVLYEAADEIERLRADNSNLRDDLARAWGLTDADAYAARTAEIERLRLLDECNIEKVEAFLREEIRSEEKISKLREALEKIAVDDPRGPGEFDCIQIARAALHTEDPSARAGSAEPK